jgi:hypothetical protein
MKLSMKKGFAQNERIQKPWTDKQSIVSEQRLGEYDILVLIGFDATADVYDAHKSILSRGVAPKVFTL